MSELSYDKNKEYMQLLNDNHMVYVIVDTLKDNKIVGSATLLIEQKLSHSYKQVGHIEDVVIDDEYRGQKLGKGLISHLTDIAHMKNCYKCILNCAQKNIAFYEKCKYTYKNNVEMSVYF
ncbi:GNAT family N-acetyltransferase [Nitrosopumilus sp.]|nr:GNAT family N-acetyltransferase [Nitrosopumilus sp.]